jgi:hypothetical protein
MIKTMLVAGREFRGRYSSPHQVDSSNYHQQYSYSYSYFQSNSHRRRSSTCFLRLAERFLDNDDDDENGNADGGDPDSTGAVAVSIAGNRINASNSWNLRLIENIDQFLMEDDDEEEEVVSAGRTKRKSRRPNKTPRRMPTVSPQPRLVRWTRASRFAVTASTMCT